MGKKKKKERRHKKLDKARKATKAADKKRRRERERKRGRWKGPADFGVQVMWPQLQLHNKLSLILRSSNT